MRVWTFQSPEVYETIMTYGVHHADIERGSYEFKNAYDWMVEQMSERIPAGKTPGYPVWVWYKWDGKNIRPDLRRMEFRDREEDMYLLELEIPDNEVLLSDFDAWHAVLNDSIISEDEAEIDWYYDEATPEEQEKFKERNWLLVFETDDSDYVQGCLWEIRKENVKNAKYCKKSVGP